LSKWKYNIVPAVFLYSHLFEVEFQNTTNPVGVVQSDALIKKKGLPFKVPEAVTLQSQLNPNVSSDCNVKHIKGKLEVGVGVGVDVLLGVKLGVLVIVGVTVGVGVGVDDTGTPLHPKLQSPSE
jgi:hypothetical protein